MSGGVMRSLVVAAALLVFAVGSAAAQSRFVVHQEGKQFVPAKLTVQKGDTVVFQNDDAVVHNVFSETPGFEFNLKRQPAGASSSTRFSRAGVAEIRCAIHPGMKLSITVR